MTTNIPKVIHAIWFGSQLPAQLKSYVDGWQKLHPDWTVILWNEEEVRGLDLICKTPFRYIRDMGQLSDIARYEILRIFGGVYLDTDVELLNRLDPLLSVPSDFIYTDHSGGPTNFFLAATPNHPITTAMCNQINRDFPFRQTGRPWSRKLNHLFATTIMQTGPRLMEDISIRHFGQRQPLTAQQLGTLIGQPNSYHSVFVVYPGLWPHGRETIRQDAFGHHHSWKSWHKNREHSDERIIEQEMNDDTYGLYGIALPKNANIIDCGGHQGLFAYTCSRLWPHAKIISFEPDPSNFKQLKTTADQAQNITAYQTALARRNGKVAFSRDQGQTGRGTVSDDPNAGLVVATQLSTMLFNLPQIDLLKIDIEGSEDIVLQDLAENGWLPKVGEIRMETHDPVKPGVHARCLELLAPTHRVVFTDYLGPQYVARVYASPI